jgi:hypothetical protein
MSAVSKIIVKIAGITLAGSNAFGIGTFSFGTPNSGNTHNKTHGNPRQLAQERDERRDPLAQRMKFAAKLRADKRKEIIKGKRRIIQQQIQAERMQKQEELADKIKQRVAQLLKEREEKKMQKEIDDRAQAAVDKILEDVPQCTMCHEHLAEEEHLNDLRQLAASTKDESRSTVVTDAIKEAEAGMEKEGLLLGCGHKFHVECMRVWVDQGKQECPMCRRTLTYPALNVLGTNYFPVKEPVIEDEFNPTEEELDAMLAYSMGLLKRFEREIAEFDDKNCFDRRKEPELPGFQEKVKRWEEDLQDARESPGCIGAMRTVNQEAEEVMGEIRSYESLGYY